MDSTTFNNYGTVNINAKNLTKVSQPLSQHQQPQKAPPSNNQTQTTQNDSINNVKEIVEAVRTLSSCTLPIATTQASEERIKPRIIPRTARAEMISKGLIKSEDWENPTFEDVPDSWGTLSDKKKKEERAAAKPAENANATTSLLNEFPTDKNGNYIIPPGLITSDIMKMLQKSANDKKARKEMAPAKKSNYVKKDDPILSHESENRPQEKSGELKPKK